MEEENREEIRNLTENGIVKFIKIILKIILGFWVEIIIFAEIIVTFALNWILTKFDAASLGDFISKMLNPIEAMGMAEMLSENLLMDAAYNIFLKSAVLWLILNILYYMISRFLKAKTVLKVELVLAVMIGLAIYTCLSIDLTGTIDTIQNLDMSKYEKYSDLLNTVNENSDILEKVDVENIVTENGEINTEVVEQILENEEVKQEVMNVLEDEEIRSEISTILESEGIDSSVLNTIVEEGLNSNTISSDMLNNIDTTEYDVNKINNVINDYNIDIDNLDLNTVYSY